jgi:tetratricopeptide (TPR) repeat protein/DNA-binding winged helix-turn-helix (wHTH) protein
MIVLRACAVDLDRREILRGGEVSRLTATEAALVGYLCARAGRVVAREELLREVWGYAPRVVSRSVDHTVARLRRKIERDPTAPDHLLSAYGAGYRWEAREARAIDPRRGNALVGRFSELAALAEPARLRTVVGPAGVGKTRLVAQHRIEDPRPAVEVDASSAADVLSLVRVVAAALERAVDADGDPIEAVGRMLAALGERLLVLDNLEQVAGAGAALARWLRLAPSLSILATSQAPVEVPGEAILSLEALPLDDAAELFAERARLARPGIQVDPAVARSVAQGVDGLPLALELAAARCAILPPEDLVTRLGLDVLADPDGRGRHASLRDALEWSWDLLGVEARGVLAACAAFRGSFDVADAEAVCGAEGTLDGLHVLQRRSLVQADGPRLRLLESVRAFAAEHQQDAAEIALRHARWALGVAGPAADALRFTRSSPELLDTVQRVSADLLAALDRVRAPDLRVALVAAIHPLLEARGPIRLLDRFLSELAPTDPTDRAVVAWLRVRFAHRTGTARDDRIARDALAVAQAQDDPRWRAACAEALAELRSGLGQYPAAEEAFRDAIAAWEAARCPFGEATARTGLALNLLEEGRVAQAEPILRESLALHRHIHNLRGEAIALDHLGRCAQLRGRPADALPLHAAATALAPALRDRRLSAILQAHLGSAWHLAGDDAEAARCWREALGVFRELLDPRFEAVTLGNLGRAALDAGQLDAARNLLEEALVVARGVSDRGTVATLLPPLAATVQELGDLALAGQLLAEAAAVQQALGRARSAWFTTWLDGVLAVEVGDLPRAAAGFRQLTTCGDPALAALAAAWSAALGGDLAPLDGAAGLRGADARAWARLRARLAP